MLNSSKDLLDTKYVIEAITLSNCKWQIKAIHQSCIKSNLDEQNHGFLKHGLKTFGIGINV
jgi:hypothetical protein